MTQYLLTWWTLSPCLPIRHMNVRSHLFPIGLVHSDVELPYFPLCIYQTLYQGNAQWGGLCPPKLSLCLNHSWLTFIHASLGKLFLLPGSTFLSLIFHLGADSEALVSYHILCSPCSEHSILIIWFHTWFFWTRSFWKPVSFISLCHQLLVNSYLQ